ncbi:hypothetical protein QPK87_24180 [Kamptonema cortianum]|nr:hypothetical protein [Kamptonema cortianum]
MPKAIVPQGGPDDGLPLVGKGGEQCADQRIVGSIFSRIWGKMQFSKVKHRLKANQVTVSVQAGMFGVEQHLRRGAKQG